MKKYYFVSYHDKNKLDEIISSEERPNMRELGLSSLSRSFETEEELIKGEGLRTDCKCKMCGNWIKTNYLNYKEFEKLNICFSCNHWSKIFATKDDPKRLIIEGTSYWAQSVEKPGGFAGFGGALFRYQRFGETVIRETRNLWCQGDIPDVWKELIPDNAKFIKG